MQGLREFPNAVTEVLAAIAYGEERGAMRSEQTIALAPDGRARAEQQHVAAQERRNYELILARLQELGDAGLTELFHPFFDAFFAHTEPQDWVEAQAFHYVGDAMVSDFADILIPLLDHLGSSCLRELYLGYGHLTDVGVTALTSSPNVSGLQCLDLCGSDRGGCRRAGRQAWQSRAVDEIRLSRRARRARRQD